MYKVKIGNNQSFVDVTLQHCGSIDYMVDYAFQNGLSITDNMVVGAELEMPTDKDKRITSYYTNNDVMPASFPTRQEIRELCDEVGSNTADFGTFSYHFDDSFYK